MGLTCTSQTASCSGRSGERLAIAFRGRTRLRTAPCCAVVKAQVTTGVRIEVEKTSWNSRRVFAAIAVAAPKRSVWSALTDYDNLHKFIPSLVDNRCLERTDHSAVLHQVGAQDVAMGVRFSAAVTLRCTEHPHGGVPASLMTTTPPAQSLHLASSSRSSSEGAQDSSTSPATSSGEWGSSSEAGPPPGSDAERLLPFPSTSLPGVEASDISFELLEGDFQNFRGIWRMQAMDERSTLLSYAVFVKPQAWLPVALIQGRIENEVVRNLEAVSKYAEAQSQKKP